MACGRISRARSLSRTRWTIPAQRVTAVGRRRTDALRRFGGLPYGHDHLNGCGKVDEFAFKWVSPPTPMVLCAFPFNMPSNKGDVKEHGLSATPQLSISPHSASHNQICPSPHTCPWSSSRLSVARRPCPSGIDIIRHTGRLGRTHSSPSLSHPVIPTLSVTIVAATLRHEPSGTLQNLPYAGIELRYSIWQTDDGQRKQRVS